MARGKRNRPRQSQREESAGSEDDIQTLKRSGKASFDRDETFDDSEDECKHFFKEHSNNSLRAKRSNHAGRVKMGSTKGHRLYERFR